MGKIISNGINYSGISGGGSSYSETVLWSGSETPTASSPYTAILSDSIENYDAIAFLCKNNQEDAYYNLPIILTSEFIVDRHFEGSYLQCTPAYYLWRLSNTTISLGLFASQSSVTYEKVIGIKFGGGSSGGGIDYSTEEQSTGLKWIDGKTIYEKVYILSNSITVGQSWVSTNIDASNFDKIISCKVWADNNASEIYDMWAQISNDTVSLANWRTDTQVGMICIQYTKT